MESRADLLMIGISSCTYRFGDVVVKVPHIDKEDSGITDENVRAVKAEANAYEILGSHARIASCLFISPRRDLIALEFYPDGNLKDYISTHSVQPAQLQNWARQMIEAVQLVHSKGIRHSDVRLDQWLLDSALNARLSDFNASGCDGDAALEIQAAKATGCEGPHHFMPRNPDEDNTVQSDLFALGAALYELEYGSAPFADESGEVVEIRFANGVFPPVAALRLGRLIEGCWHGRYTSASEVLLEGEQFCRM